VNDQAEPAPAGCGGIEAAPAASTIRPRPNRLVRHSWLAVLGALSDWAPAWPTQEALGLAGVVLIGFGCARFSGLYRLSGLIAVGLGACLLMLIPGGVKRGASPVTWSVAVFLGAITSGLVFHVHPQSAVALVAGTAVAIMGGAAAVLVVASDRTWLRVVGCLVAGSVSLATLLEHLRWGRASIDVFNFAQRLTLQLLHGKDPYAIALPTTTPHVPLAHYTYWPGVLLLSVPGRLIGDIRVSNLLAAVALIAAITVLAKRHGGGEHAWRCLVLCLTLPFFPFMILQAWAEVYLMAAIALWILLRDKHRTSSVAILGVAMATVPTPLPLLVFPFLWWRRARVEIVAAAVLAVAISLPFAVWAGPANFVSYTLGFQAHLAPRVDGLDLDAAWIRLTGAWLPTWVWPAWTGTTLLLLSRARPRSWTVAFYLGAVLLAVAFLFAKWAFFNYYFLVVMGVILGGALQRPSTVSAGAPEDPIRISKSSDPVAVAAGVGGP